jgi:hypothetical protein
MFSLYVLPSISPKWNLPLRYSDQMLYEFMSIFMCTTCSTHLTLLDLITVIIQLKR